jgi:hypothetical protein
MCPFYRQRGPVHTEDLITATMSTRWGMVQGHLVFGCGVAQQEENELRVLSYVGRCFPGTLHMSQNPFSR